MIARGMDHAGENQDPRLALALAVAREAGNLLMKRYRDEPARGLEYKGQVDLVTDADREVEDLLRERILSERPGEGILAEESAPDQGGEGALWVLDPLDGTTNFVHHYPVFAVSIAFRDGGETRLGVVHVPPLGETYWAMRGQGAWRDGRSIRVTSTDDLLEALLVTGFADVRARDPRTTLPALLDLLPRSRGVRRSGAAAFDLASVACGRCDAFWERRLNAWDVAAGALIVKEAGGRVTDFRGGDAYEERGEIVASNGKLHEVVRETCLRLVGVPDPAGGGT
jgi:myo-inositol-1(or 4)-monophosphatase